METWKVVINYPNYQISSLGRVKGFRGIKKPYKSFDGYLSIMFNSPVRKSFQVHRLVASAFHPNPHNHPEVDHKNSIRDDNRSCNVRWRALKDNRPGRVGGVGGGRVGKPVIALSSTSVEFFIFNSIKEAAEAFKIDPANVHYALKRRSIRKGYKWYYIK